MCICMSKSFYEKINLLLFVQYESEHVMWKRDIIQSWIYRILQKVNQVIYTLDTIFDPNIMTLAQVVLEIFYSQAYIGL